MKVDIPSDTGPGLSRIADPQRLRAVQQTGLSDAAHHPVFDGPARLAQRVLEGTIALVSLIDDQRQIVLSQQGLPASLADLSEVPLTQSICRLLVERDTPALALPEIPAEPALRDVPGLEAFGRAYLGVPLRATEGHVLGSLCVFAPERRDWTQADAEVLADIAAGVEAELRLRRQIAIAHHEQSIFRTILDQMPVGVKLAEVGTARLVDINGTARMMMGPLETGGDLAIRPQLDAVAPDGRRYSGPDMPLYRAAKTGEVITAEEMRLSHPDGSIRDLLISARRVSSDPPLAVATVLDVTDRRAAERAARHSAERLAHFHDVTRDGIIELDAEDRIRYCNAALRARVRDAHGDDFAEGLEGRTLPEAFPVLTGSALMQTLAAARASGTEQTIDHATQDGAILETTIYPDGTGVLIYLRDVTEERRAAQARDTLARELNHRVKNLFAMMSGLIGMTARHAASPQQMAEGLRARVHALARAHQLIAPGARLESGFRGTADLTELVRNILAPYADPDDTRIALSGPVLRLNHTGATNLAMVLHELTTNAVKYGALSHPGGRLEMRWDRHAESLQIDWRESGGPHRDTAPEQTGFGSRLIDLTLRGQLRGSYGTEWPPGGFEAQMTVPLDLIEG